MTSAYINVLNAVNKSLGLPKYPAIPGLSRQARQSQQGGTVPLRQIQVCGKLGNFLRQRH